MIGYDWGMIGQLTGKISHLNKTYAIINVGGVGYKVYFRSEILTSLKENEEIMIWTHLAVREDALDLYGFIDREELDYFHLLIAISGIGPKSALLILSQAPPEILRKAVLSNDNTYLTKVSGIGRKSADKIIIELRDKLGALALSEANSLEGSSDVVDALVALGYSLKEARMALQKISPDTQTTDAKIKEALKILGK